MKRQSGFSLIELVATIMLMGVMAATVSVFISGPIFSYVEVANRANLVSLANQSLSVMQRDIKASAPNSIRIHSGKTLELIHAVTAIPYKVGGENIPDGLALNDGFVSGGGDQYFRVLGTFLEEHYDVHPSWSALIYHKPSYTNNDFNKPEAGVNVYGARVPWTTTIFNDKKEPKNTRHYGHVLSSPGLTIIPGDKPILLNLSSGDWLPDASQAIIGLHAPHAFAAHSPNQIVYFIDGPVTYDCNLATGELTKYWGYQIQEEQPQPAYNSKRPIGALSAVVANHVTNCEFSFDSIGDMTLVNLNLDLTSRRGETITLQQQVHVRNDP